MKILFIDDDLDDLEMFSDVIKRIGSEYKFCMATDGQEGLNMLKLDVPNIVFLDINMPKLDGRKVLELIRHDPALNDVRVCILSTSITPSECKLYRQMGTDHCLCKPNSFQELTHAFQRLLNAQGRTPWVRR
jgi:CheY-like chemotaxis protein